MIEEHQMGKKLSNEIYELITGFLVNELNDDQLVCLNKWLEEDELHLDEFNRIRSTWILYQHETGKKNFDVSSNWKKLEKKITVGTVKGRKKIMLRFTPLKYAASLLLCFVSGTILSAILLHKQPAEPIAMNAVTTINVPLGSKNNVILPDGSTAWLNAGSTISYPADFGVEKRDLQLIGEAFFDVASDSLKPFNVNTDGMTVQALGTRFNVKAYPEDNTMTATLEEGIVNVLIRTSPERTTPQTVKLKPNEQLVIQKSQEEHDQTKDHQRQTAAQSVQSQLPAIKEITVFPNVKTILSTSWKDEKWIIDDEPLPTFVTDLERRYNLNIRFTSKELENYKFSGTIENETVEQILTALTIAAPVEYSFNKNNVLLSLNKKNKDKFDKVLKK